MKIAFAMGFYLKSPSTLKPGKSKFQQGGAEIQVSYIIDELQKNGHEIVYLKLGDENKKEPEMVNDDFRLYTVKKPYKGLNLLHHLNRAHINTILESEKPDILYQRGDFVYSDLISSYGYENNIPVVSGLSMERHCHKEKINFNHMFLINIIDRILKTRYYDRSSLIVFQSEEQRSKFKRNFGKDGVIIGNGHPIPSGPFVKNPRPTIIWVGNIKPIKQVEIYIQAARKLMNYDIDFLCIGQPGIGDYHDRVRSQFEGLENFHYLGELPLEETNELIGRSVLLVNTSSSEGFSNTFIQAWLRETPVLSLNSNPDGILTREGIGYHAGTEDRLTNIIKKISNNPEERKIMGKKAREYAVEKYDINLITKQYISEFNKLLTAE